MTAYQTSMRWLAAGALAVFLGGCASQVPTRLGMVKDPATGLQFGSVVDNTIITDASFHKNRKIKVRVRNTSGDTAFDLRDLAGRLGAALAANGYEPTADDDFGLLVDLNVVYSGQVQSSLATEYALLGAAGGGVTGAAAGGGRVGTAAGVLAGATFGHIVGSYATEDTYIIVAEVTFAIVKEPLTRPSKTIVFSRSPTPGEDEDERRRKEEERSIRGLGKTFTSNVSVFAGGTNTPQSRIAEEVRQRLIRIVGDII